MNATLLAKFAIASALTLGLVAPGLANAEISTPTTSGAGAAGQITVR